MVPTEYQARPPRVLYKISDTMILPIHQPVAEISCQKSLQCSLMATMAPRNIFPQARVAIST